jgi:hypothetical protein
MASYLFLSIGDLAKLDFVAACPILVTLLERFEVLLVHELGSLRDARLVLVGASNFLRFLVAPRVIALAAPTFSNLASHISKFTPGCAFIFTQSLLRDGEQDAFGRRISRLLGEKLGEKGMGVGEGGLDKMLRVVDLLFTLGGNEKITFKLAKLGITAEIVEGKMGSALLVEEIADQAF